mgnify:CR=1 FL=1
MLDDFYKCPIIPFGFGCFIPEEVLLGLSPWILIELIF